MKNKRQSEQGTTPLEQDRVQPYITRVMESPLSIAASDWNELLLSQPLPSPFMRHEYLTALHESGCASAPTGWTLRIISLWLPGTNGQTLQAACALYLKTHSYGEYVFDWAWARAHHDNGLAYYPKAIVAPPFTPVPGTRLMARDANSRAALLQALVQVCQDENVSSLHLLFAADEDLATAAQAGLMQRHTVQFHWQNSTVALETALSQTPPTDVTAQASAPPTRQYTNFEDFLGSLQAEKRKKIRQERRKVAQAGIRFRWVQGAAICQEDWDFFYDCYERTYLEHGNAPYLSRDFFERMARTMPENWLLFVAERDPTPTEADLHDPAQTSTQCIPIACSLIALSTHNEHGQTTQVAYGRYWGAIERVDCLHFEACYYQPLQWCIDHGVSRFEGGAQGEHKMARALLPVKTSSAHWLAHPAFAQAVQRFLDREGQGVEHYLTELNERNPLRSSSASPASLETKRPPKP